MAFSRAVGRLDISPATKASNTRHARRLLECRRVQPYNVPCRGLKITARHGASRVVETKTTLLRRFTTSSSAETCRCGHTHHQIEETLKSPELRCRGHQQQPSAAAAAGYRERHGVATCSRVLGQTSPPVPPPSCSCSSRRVPCSWNPGTRVGSPLIMVLAHFVSYTSSR